ncbi:MAG: HAD family phosphatase, partial [Clostridia bacterium]|nr:HAD family phosphatase [Clostridia bacterium]
GLDLRPDQRTYHLAEKINREKWIETAKMLGYEMTYEQWFGLLGTNEESEKQYLYRLYGNDCPAEIFRSVRMKLIGEHADKYGIPIKKGAKELLEFFKENGVPCVVATSSVRARAEKFLERAGLLPYFDDLTCGDEVTLGKPNPELFEKAAKKADVEPEYCIVFEDSENGIIAADRANMLPVCVPDLQPPTETVKKLAVITETLDGFVEMTKKVI